MRLLLVSDLHYTLPQLDWVVRVAPGYDLVVVAGESLDVGSAVPLDVQTLVILRYLALLQAAGRVVVSSGNHDLTGPDAAGEQGVGVKSCYLLARSTQRLSALLTQRSDDQ